MGLPIKGLHIDTLEGIEIYHISVVILEVVLCKQSSIAHYKGLIHIAHDFASDHLTGPCTTRTQELKMV